MRLYHCSPTANNSSIREKGIDPRFSRGARPEIWLHSWSKLPWAIRHVASKHQASRVTVWAVDARGEALTHRRRCLWTCGRIVRHPKVVCEVTTEYFLANPVRERSQNGKDD